ncbi:anti-sigma factor [Nocardiopsis sp. N85]|uniref:anti-sigma factor n=1 Tax=Nocardiopsis sp. N85 TaxID=3029400 RepID=UPI00237F2B72|nr:anti-sigma factor [Nocardiopsis sp. N85]MDE3725131.1 anti-sigma factor [Nocardiopsis sp. N85]
MSRRLRQDPHTLSGAYALNALPPEETVRFEDHLARCDSCVQEVRGFAETAARLGTTAAAVPPPGLRARVLSEVSRTRQLAPPPVRLAEPDRRWWTRGSTWAIAACLAVAVALGAVSWDQARHIETLQENERMVAAVLSDPAAEYTTAEPMEGVFVAAVYSEAHGSLVFSGHGLEPLRDEDYQLWFTRVDGTVYSAGVLPVDEQGVVAPIPAAPEGADTQGVAVTVEPLGGSEQPTSEPIMAMPIQG